MFRSLLYDHPQESSFVLSALPLLRLLTLSFAHSVCGRMPSEMQCLHKKIIPWFYLPRYEGIENI
jgi:hypothetical protein